MRTLLFQATGQSLVATSSLEGLVVGSKGYLFAKFELDEEHDNCAHIAVFSSPSCEASALRLDEKDTCEIPAEVLADRVFTVYLVSVRSGYRIQTGKVTVRQNG